MMPAATPLQFRIVVTSGTRRTGLKGREAAAQLTALGIPVPAGPNQVVRFHTPAGGRCLRLGQTEFLIEQDEGDTLLATVDASAGGAAQGLLSALRSDRCFLLAGTGLYPALRQIAAFDFESPAFGIDAVVMTLMAGISVTFIREPMPDGEALRLWCDAGFGDYLNDCFITLGGQPAGDLPFLSREPQGPTP